MMPVLMPAWISSLKPGDQQQVVVRPHGQQQDDGQTQYHPIQLDAHDVLPDQHRQAERGAQRERYCAHDDERGDEAARDEHHDQQDEAERGNAGDDQVVVPIPGIHRP
jgi:hypothetical protein